MGNGKHKGPYDGRGISIPTGLEEVPDDDLQTDPRLEGAVIPALPNIADIPTRPHAPVDLSDNGAEEPTMPGAARFDTHNLPVVSVPETEADRLAKEGLIPVDPASYGTDDEATAALNLPTDLPGPHRVPDAPTEAGPRPDEPPQEPTRAASPKEWARQDRGPAPRGFDSDVGTQSNRARVPATGPVPRLAELDSTVGTRSERGPVPMARPISAADARHDGPEDPSGGLPGFVDHSVLQPAPASKPYHDDEPASLPGPSVHDAAFEVDEDTFGPNEPLAPGTTLAFGLYRIDRLIGEGATTRVYQATDLRSDQIVALKEHRDPGDALRLPAVRSLLERFRQEEPAPAVLTHPGSVQLLDFLDDTTRGPVAVMEYVPAGDLESFLAHRGRPLSPREAAGLFLRVTETLAHALEHGVVHGDIQPRNILLTADAKPKIDLIMPVLTGQPITRPNSDFAAPEVRSGSPAGPGADVYGLGASLYQAVTDPNVAAEGGEAPGPIEPIIARCVQDRIEDRFPTAREVGGALAVVMKQQVGRAKPAGSKRMMQIGLGLFAIALGLGIFLTQRDPDSMVAMPPVAAEDSIVPDALMADARRYVEAGQILEAASTYKRIMDANPSLTAAGDAFETLTATTEYKKALRALRKRLRKATPDDDGPSLRNDLSLLGVLAPRDALIDHWRSRLNQSNDMGAAGGSPE